MSEPTAGSWPKGRLVAHPEPGKVWVQVPHRNDIGSDWIEADELLWHVERIVAARAEALREAARDLPGLDTIRTHGDAANWLRARADSLTPTTPARTIPTTASVRANLAADTAADNKARWNRALKGGA